jgi:hypothetical protein
MFRRFLIAFGAVVALADPAAGQSRLAAPALLSPAAANELGAARSTSSQSLARRSLHAVGGAVLGAGLGYFTSHVVYNDWDKTVNSSFADKRRTYSLSGAAVGALAGLFVGGGTPAVTGPARVTPVGRGSEGVETISHEEIAASAATNAYDLVQSLRPNWLVIRGVKHFTEQGQLTGSTDRAVTVTPGTPQIRVYLESATLGDVDELRRIPTVEVQSIQFLSPAQASLRFGGGHAHGAIVVSMATI